MHRSCNNEENRGLFVKRYLLAVGTFLILADSLLITLGRQRLSLDLSFVSAAICLNLYLALFFLLGNNRCQSYLEQKVKESAGVPFLFLLFLFASYLVYAAGTRSFQWLLFLKLAIYMLLPTFVYLSLKNPPDRWQWQDVVVTLTLWLPLDFRWMRDVWPWPGNSLAYSLNSLLATCLAVFLFVCVRRLGQVGYHYQLERSDWMIGLRNFLMFALVALPIGLCTRFIALSKNFAAPWQIVLSALGIFLFIAIPEELLFRGIIQNFMERSWLGPMPALIVGSLIFGASHLNNGPRPDWRYFLLASIAGLFYGNAYQRTRKLLAPAIVHTLVDTAWRGFFRGM
jgi:CAAX protease family protein